MNLLSNGINAKIVDDKKNSLILRNRINNPHKNMSDNNLKYTLCNKLNKHPYTRISYPSDLSTKNSITGSIKDKKSKRENKIGINPVENLCNENLDSIIKKKVKIFEALENLLVADKSNDKEEKEKNDINKNTQKPEEKNNTNLTTITQNKTEKKCFSVPKLDFSKIYKGYTKNPLIVQEVEYLPKYKNGI